MVLSGSVLSESQISCLPELVKRGFKPSPEEFEAYAQFVAGSSGSVVERNPSQQVMPIADGGNPTTDLTDLDRMAASDEPSEVARVRGERDGEVADDHALAAENTGAA